MSSLEKLVHLAKPVGDVAVEALNFAVVQQKHEREDQENQRLAKKEAHDMDEQKRKSAMELAEMGKHWLAVEEHWLATEKHKIMVEKQAGKELAEIKERKLLLAKETAEA